MKKKIHTHQNLQLHELIPQRNPTEIDQHSVPALRVLRYDYDRRSEFDPHRDLRGALVGVLHRASGGVRGLRRRIDDRLLRRLEVVQELLVGKVNHVIAVYTCLDGFKKYVTVINIKTKAFALAYTR